ncbi:MAG: beta-ketoacyl-[acyl-carrier-protein] synthase family protein [Saprospiraceae bacterium]|nr:beta-ketoacyl-[acyl-carrier-protein] synthase family protein [Saprospiraceae bacterium]
MIERVLITGVGVVSPFGIGRDRYWDNLVEGRSAARMITSFDASMMPTRFWANAPLSEEDLMQQLPNQRAGKLMPRAVRMAMIAAEEAMTQSGVDPLRLDPFRFGISVGAGGIGLVDQGLSPIDFQMAIQMTGKTDIPVSEGEYWQYLLNHMHPLNPIRTIPNAISAHLAIQYQAMGSCLTYTTACTSSAQSIGEALLALRHGRQDIMIAGGADSSTNPSNLLSFSLLGALSTRNDEIQHASRPFDRDRDGFLLSEGAAFLILETETHCRQRGGEPLAELSGYGTASDAYRVTDEPEDGRGAIRAMQNALRDAGLTPDQIDHINAHGTSTRMNDPIESFAIHHVFGERANRIPVTSNKSMIGHLVAGAGSIELVAAVMTIREACIPPTINLQHRDEACDLDIVAGQARTGQVRTVLSNSFGFGGQNACLIVRQVNHE